MKKTDSTTISPKNPLTLPQEIEEDTGVEVFLRPIFEVVNARLDIVGDLAEINPLQLSKSGRFGDTDTRRPDRHVLES